MKIKCPVCKSNEFVSLISYGYPSPEMWEKEAMGEIVLGGCSISENNLDYCCDKCDYKWQKSKRKNGKHVEEDI